jgi:hypothetical protein
MKPKRDIEIEMNIRRGLIDVLELFSSPEEQIEYQDKVPHVYIPDEMINQWQDWVDHDRKDRYKLGVYTQEELDAIWSFDAIWDREAERIDSRLTLAKVQESEPWIRLMKAANDALQIFRKSAEQGAQPDAFGAG